jgi:hypothetical protein
VKVTTESAGADVYVGLLFVALASMITGIIFLVLELGKYSTGT